MKRKEIVSILFAGAAAMALTTAPTWAQSQKKDSSVGGSQSERVGPGADTPVPKGSPSAGSTEGSKAGKGPGSASESQATGSQQDIRQAQEALKSQGHDPGPIDGVMGSKTKEALKAFQGATGLKQTGNLDAETKQKLKIEGGSSGAGSSKGSGSMGRGESPKGQKEPSSPMGK